MGEVGHTICLLELEEPLERVVVSQLGHQGYRVVRGESLAAVAVSDPAPAAVILDLDSLDPNDWPDDYIWLMRCRTRGPVLLLVSDRIPPRRARTLDGATILYKPFTSGELRQQLAACLPATCGIKQ
jgi:DNA-binding response OmpR family regulator